VSPAAAPAPARGGGRASLARLYETVRRLRPSQVGHRLVRRLRPSRETSRGGARWRPDRPAPPREALRPSSPPHDGPREGGWSFAGRLCAALEGGGPDWRPEAFPTRLARYHAHYFDWLEPLEAGASRDLGVGIARAAVEAWGRAGRSLGPDATHPYVRSRRILALGLSAARRGSAAPAGVAAADARALLSQREWDVRGNHLVANGAALVVAGSAIAARDAARWREAGHATLSACVREQVLGDGVH
jgi:hypothetical protein